jgi:RNA polymerase-interacting CarD/CdnL/TRCF family regulator
LIFSQFSHLFFDNIIVSKAEKLLASLTTVAGCRISIFHIRRFIMVKRNWKLIGLVLLISLIACPLTYADKDKAREASKIEKQMWESAKKLDFERAARLRDKLKMLKGEFEREVSKEDVPKAALATLKKLAGRAKITEFAEEIEHGHTFYEGSWKSRSGANIDVLVTKSGDLVEIEEQVDDDDVPKTVLKVARKKAGKGAKLTFEKKTMILYEVKFSKDNARHELLLTPDGRRVEEEVEKGKPHDDDKDDDDEDDDKDDEDDEDDEEDDDEDDDDEDDGNEDDDDYEDDDDEDDDEDDDDDDD